MNLESNEGIPGHLWMPIAVEGLTQLVVNDGVNYRPVSHGLRVISTYAKEGVWVKGLLNEFSLRFGIDNSMASFFLAKSRMEREYSGLYFADIVIYGNQNQDRDQVVENLRLAIKEANRHSIALPFQPIPDYPVDRLEVFRDFLKNGVIVPTEDKLAPFKEYLEN